MNGLTLLVWAGAVLLALGVILFIVGIFYPKDVRDLTVEPVIRFFRFLITRTDTLLKRAINARSTKMRLLNFGSALIQIGLMIVLVFGLIMIATDDDGTDDQPNPGSTTPTATST